MKSFKKFLLENDPLKVLSKLDKKKGVSGETEEDYKNSVGDITIKNIKTREIPLKGYDEDKSEEVENAYFEYLQKNKEKNITLNVRSFNIKDLIPIQNSVRIDDLHRFQQKITQDDRQTPIHVATYKGKNYILDGHHSIFAARLRGDNTINAKHTIL